LVSFTRSTRNFGEEYLIGETIQLTVLSFVYKSFKIKTHNFSMVWAIWRLGIAGFWWWWHVHVHVWEGIPIEIDWKWA